MTTETLPQLKFASQADWSDWLAMHHATASGVWVKMAKKESGISSVNYAQALECALCYGWIDGLKKSVDKTWWIQKFSPRKPRSIWSQVNRAKVLDLIERGLMQPAGQAAIDLARRNGQWDAAYEPQGRATVPPDLEAALQASPKAAEFFATLKGANRYAILFRLQTARKPETRAARLQKFLGMLERGETLH